MQGDDTDHEKVSETECSLSLIEPIGQFKCPNCGRVHAGFAEADVIALVADANTQGRHTQVSVDDYRYCFDCKTPSNIFLKANPGEVPFLSTLQAVIAPKIECSQEQPRFIEVDGTFEIPVYVSYARHQRQAAGQEADRRGEFQQEIPQLPPESCEQAVLVETHFERE